MLSDAAESTPKIIFGDFWIKYGSSHVLGTPKETNSMELVRIKNKKLCDNILNDGDTCYKKQEYNWYSFWYFSAKISISDWISRLFWSTVVSINIAIGFLGAAPNSPLTNNTQESFNRSNRRSQANRILFKEDLRP